MSGVTQRPTRRVVGVDLGTTHCAVAWAPGLEPGEAVVDFPIQQLVGPGLCAELPLLPSNLYLASHYEFGPSQLRLPWGGELPAEAEEGSGGRGPVIGGQFARQLGARTAGRLVSSAKSWLCHPRVDRRAAILPWGGQAELHKLSPVEASAAYLRHIASAWDLANPGFPLAEQDLVLTVPASFDDTARSLTVEAARAAGLARLSLVEEPQAAFQDLAWRRHKDLDTLLGEARLILVIDVGGGTTDLSLIRVTREAGAPVFERVAVGEHLMLGGDNMDTALARDAEPRLAGEGRRLSAAQWGELVQAARAAKESLLAEQAPERHRVAVAGEGSRLLGRTLSWEFSREDLRGRLLEGFFPLCAEDESPRRQARTGLQELGLPYAQDPAITRHIAGFLQQHALLIQAASASGLPRPDAVLLNGGVFKAPILVERLLELFRTWWPEAGAPRLLPHASLDLAVARGAVAHGLSKRGLGPRIGGGSAHAYYVGVARAAVGRETPVSLQGLCLLPKGQEEGVVVELRGLGMELSLGRPVRFPLFASTADLADKAGALRDLGEAFAPMAPVQAVLKSADGRQGAEPVFLRACLTEVGTVDLSCVSEKTGQEWRLEFDVRGTPETTVQAVANAGVAQPETEGVAPASTQRAGQGVSDGKPASPGSAGAVVQPAGAALEPGQVAACEKLLREAFEGRGPASEAKELRLLLKKLESVLGAREGWSVAQLRGLWTLLQPFSGQRRRSADHERSFYQLFGYTLRPGFGDTLDPWRCEQAKILLKDLVRHAGDPSVWSEFWILWRRVACGLPETEQVALWQLLKPHLARRVSPRPPKHLPKPKGTPFEGLEEMLRVAASLELIPVAEKLELGGWLVERVREPGQVAGAWSWALGRLGARVPVGGGQHRVVPPEQAELWLRALLDKGLGKVDGGPFAATLLARRSGDRAKDISDALRQDLLTQLGKAAAPERLLRQVSEVVELEAAEEAKALGDSLPVGLRMRES